jgi:hypothetical protein
LLRIILVNAYDVPVRQRPRISVPVILLASTSAAERDSAILNAMLDLPGLVVLTHDMTGDDDGDVEIRRRVTTAAGLVTDQPVHLDHPCLGCLAREDLVPALADLLPHHPGAVLVALPLGADLLPATSTVAGRLDGALAGYRLAGTVAVQSGHGLIGSLDDGDEDVLTHLAEADVVVVTDAGLGAVPNRARSLADALRSAGSVLVDGIDGRWFDAAIVRTADPEVLARRSDPAHACPAVPGEGAAIEEDGTVFWPGGVWRAELTADLPLEPGRLLDEAPRIAAPGLASRGRFAVANRHGVPCGWVGVGASVRLGTLPAASCPVTSDGRARGMDGRPGAATRLVVVGYDADPERVAQAFARAVSTASEAAEARANPSADDPLAPYLGDAVETSDRDSAR